MTMKEWLFVVGGCGGTGVPPSLRIDQNKFLTEVERTQFGTHTTALGIVVNDVGLFFDNGTGVQDVARVFLNQNLRKVYGFQTHMHFDHRNGIHMNGLLFVPNLVERIFAPKINEISFQKLFDQDFAPSSWPVSPAQMGIRHEIVEFSPGDRLDVMEGVETFLLPHPGGSIAYKVRIPGRTVVIATDCELAEESVKAEFSKFIDGAHMLYVDIQYRQSEYEGKQGIGISKALPRKGWGHSTPDMVEDVLKRCKSSPEFIYVGHHDNDRTDDELAEYEKEVMAQLGVYAHQVRFARQSDLFSV